ncbi:ABC transporter substrate-binding protein [Clostridium aminobutyricum]|uniref:ABC transporter substrate-binding protein n=1 Tax=Clostridium aminobutyricum TaxID=33953 RepID=A0A939D7U9_CLOAM|nr:ABC transporter substrate-binding protein [Clostridium aminobutyricum]MBN7772726.1 ABC transporter substrate-binding protein [Clostridium aminobutyricum]
MKRYSLALLLIVVLLIGLLSGCGGDKETIKATQAEAKIGLNLELTGPLAYYGEGTLNGMTMAVDEINQAGGINGMKINLIVTDNKSDPVRAAYLQNRLLTRDGAITTVGPSTSFNFIETIPAAMENRIPTIASHSTADEVTVDRNGNVYAYVFRTTFNDSFQGTTMANFALNNLGARRAVTIEEQNNVYSEGLVRSFTRAFEEGGGTIASSKIYQKGDKDFESMLNEIKQEEYDVIFLPAYFQEAGLIIKQARDAGITQPILATDAVDTPVLLEIAGPSALNNVYLTTDFSSLNTDPKVQNFIADFKKKFGTEPISSDARGYDTAYFIADAIERTGSLDPQVLTDAYATTENFNGVTGTFSMGPEHNPIKSILVIGLVNGVPTTSVEVQPQPQPQPQPQQ